MPTNIRLDDSRRDDGSGCPLPSLLRPELRRQDSSRNRPAQLLDAVDVDSGVRDSHRSCPPCRGRGLAALPVRGRVPSRIGGRRGRAAVAERPGVRPQSPRIDGPASRLRAGFCLLSKRGASTGPGPSLVAARRGDSSSRPCNSSMAPWSPWAASATRAAPPIP